MLKHLQELMEDAEHYGWPILRAYHAAWLQHIEQGRAVWGDVSTKFRLQHVVVWHHVVTLVEPSHTYTVNYQLATPFQPHQNFNTPPPIQYQTQVCQNLNGQRAGGQL